MSTNPASVRVLIENMDVAEMFGEEIVFFAADPHDPTKMVIIFKRPKTEEEEY
jgi:hypothetical protein